MKIYQFLKVHSFPSSDVRFKYFSCAFMNFHEKYQTFKVQMWDSSIFHALSWILMKIYQTFNVHSFLSSDVRLKYYSCAFMNFHENISIFKSSLFSQFRCEIQVFFMRFHQFSWKYIKLSKFTFFLIQMWDSSIFHALSWIFMKKYQTFKVHSFLSTDVRLKYYSCAFMNFHEKISNFQSSLFPSSDVR
jgi:hypothetical protein